MVNVFLLAHIHSLAILFSDQLMTFLIPILVFCHSNVQTLTQLHKLGVVHYKFHHYLGEYMMVKMDYHLVNSDWLL